MLKSIQKWLHNNFLKKYGFGWLYRDFLHFRILLTDDCTYNKQTQIIWIKHGPSYKQLGVTTNRTPYVCESCRGHHNTEPRTWRRIINGQNEQRVPHSINRGWTQETHTTFGARHRPKKKVNNWESRVVI